jgi:hypothetical protein
MSLASAVVLLQTALSLLTLVNSNPSLPQSMRDNATAVAQHAISEAHATLASKSTSADVAEDDIASSADEAIAQAALSKTPGTQMVSLAPSSTKAGPAYLYPNPSLTPGAELTTDAAPVQTVSVSAPAPQVTTTTADASPAAYYTSSYHTAKYWYPASCSGWHSLSKAYLETFPTLDALLTKYPGRIEDPGC